MTSILFTTTDAVLSRAIRAATQSPVSHVVFGTKIEGFDVVIGASLFGVYPVTRETFFANGARRIWEFEIPEEEDPTLTAMVPFFGSPYDYRGLLSFGWMLAMKEWTKRKIKAPASTPHTLICSEFVVRVMASKGLAVWNALDPESVEPSELLPLVHTWRSLTIGAP